MNKIYVLDTSVLLQDPNSLYVFAENDIVIPSVVLEEVDAKKHRLDELGKNARHASRILDAFRGEGTLHDGVELPQGGKLYVELNHRSFMKLQEYFGEVTNDNRILAVALNLHLEEEEKPLEQRKYVVLVSKDALMRVKADAIGLVAEDYLSDQVVRYDELYTGYQQLYAHPSAIDQFYMNGQLAVEELVAEQPFFPHHFLILKDQFGSNKSALGKLDGEAKRVQPLNFVQEPIWGISAKNAQQKMALELLLDDQIPLVTLTGKAGTGKTLLSLAVGLMKTEDEKCYNKLLVARPIIPMGKDIGYLPGEKEEKLRPWMQPVYDNLEYLFHSRSQESIDRILAGLKSIQVEALTYIRGRSIPEQFIIVDEAQNLSKHEVKTIVSRVGEGSKIVLMGDPEQIDHPYLDATNNGLTYIVEQFKQQQLSGQVKLEKGERSPLAQLAADLL